MADALNFYRKHEDPKIAIKFKGSEATEEFLLKANNFFDAVNSRIPANKVQLSNWGQIQEVGS